MNEITQANPPEKNEKNRPLLPIAAAMYIAAYCYISYFIGSERHLLWFGLFVAAFIALGEYANLERARSAESWVWLGCAAVMTLGYIFGKNTVWEYQEPELFIHAMAVWWLLSRSGALIEGESGRFLPLDAFNGLILIPFGNFFLRIRTIVSGLRGAQRGKGSKAAVIGTVLAVLSAVGLLIWATLSLADADWGFRRLMAGILRHLNFHPSEDFWNFVLRLILSLPVGAYLFGLTAGAVRADKTRLRAEAEKTDECLARLRLVPNAVWTAVLAVFCLLYLVFFIVQGSYLFGAFAHKLPEGFIVSQYARQGFFELCQVMGITFVLLWIAVRSGAGELRGAEKLLFTLLLIFGMLFAVVAFSKLALYISCFGFTAKRIESCWLVLVLFAGCVAAGLRLWTGKRTMKAWMLFSAVTLSLTCLF